LAFIRDFLFLDSLTMLVNEAIAQTRMNANEIAVPALISQRGHCPQPDQFGCVDAD